MIHAFSCEYGIMSITLADDEVIRYGCLKYGSRGRYAEDVLKDAGIQTHPRDTNA
jgi:hypothetical protein